VGGRGIMRMEWIGDERKKRRISMDKGRNVKGKENKGKVKGGI
jgi:hypothetical protein